jgi:hypothetical protein
MVVVTDLAAVVAENLDLLGNRIVIGGDKPPIAIAAEILAWEKTEASSGTPRACHFAPNVGTK